MEETAITIHEPLIKEPLVKKPFTISDRTAWYYAVGQIVVCIALLGLVIGVIVWYAGQ